MSRQTAPDEGSALAVEESDDPTSPQDQGDEVEVAPVAANKQPRVDDQALLQRAFTQSQQRWADLRKGLGLGKDATPDDILAAIAAAQAPATAAVDEYEEEGQALAPAQVLELEARAEAAEWKYQAALYPQTADAAREFTAFARTESDPETLTLKFYEILTRFSGEAPAEAEAAAAAEYDEGPEQIDVGIGDSPAADIQTDAAALARLRGSGRVAEGMRHIPGLARVLGS